MQNGDVWQRRANILICISVLALAVYLLFRYAVGAVFPFVIAFAAASPISSLAKKSAKRFHGPVKAWAAFYIISFWILLFLLVALAVGKLLTEAYGLLEYALANSEKISGAFEKIMNFFENIPLVGKLFESGIFGTEGSSSGGAIPSLQNIAGNIGSVLARGAWNVVLGTPRAAVFILVSVVSSVYLACDYDKIIAFILELLPTGLKKRTTALRRDTSRGIKAYVRAYFYLFLITFGELYAGLLILQRKYALILSLVIAFFDVLPFFGVGTVLLPWGIWLIVNGEYTVGIGMLLVFAIMTVVRQVAEPKLVGDGLGVHPFISLASMYIGIRILGLAGILFVPVCLIAVGAYKDIKEKNKEK